MSPKTTKRIITPIDRANAKRLLEIFNKQKNLAKSSTEDKLTQSSLAKLCGYTQPTVNQYLNCIIPLNTDAIFKFATALNVNPTNIAPSYKNVSSLFTLSKAKTVTIQLPIIGSITGKKAMASTKMNIDKETLSEDFDACGVLIDSDVYQENTGYPKGTMLIISMLEDPYVKNRNIVLRKEDTDHFRLYRTKSIFAKTILCIDYINMKEIRFNKSELLQVYLVISTSYRAP